MRTSPRSSRWVAPTGSRTPGPARLHLVEVQVGDYLGEDDIERLADDYGRA